MKSINNKVNILLIFLTNNFQKKKKKNLVIYNFFEADNPHFYKKNSEILSMLLCNNLFVIPSKKEVYMI